jgi:hypothetical protein
MNSRGRMCNQNQLEDGLGLMRPGKVTGALTPLYGNGRCTLTDLFLPPLHSPT